MARRVLLMMAISTGSLLLAAPAHADDLWCLLHWSHC